MVPRSTALVATTMNKTPKPITTTDATRLKATKSLMPFGLDFSAVG